MHQYDIFLLILVLGSIIYWIWGYARKCPNCKKWWSRIVLQREFLRTEGRYENVTKYEKFRNNSGEVVLTKESEVPEYVEYNYFKVICKCKRCNYDWDFVEYNKN